MLLYWCVSFPVISRQREILGDGSNKPVPVALCFDEITLHKDIQMDQAQQMVYGPHDQAQTVMIRGLFKNFKQPVYYEFDKTMTKDILFDLIHRLEDIGLSVESVTSDMGAKNMSLWKELGIRPGNSSFEYNGRQIELFADVPHLLKLLRNHFLDQGFILKSGALVVKNDVQQLLLFDAGELRPTHKLKIIHFDCKGSQRQKVALAAQLFSRSTASGLRLLFKDKKELADFIELINNAFDILNSRSSEGHKQYDYALGWESEFKKFDDQKQILLKAKEEISGMRMINIKLYQTKGNLEPVKSLLPFQKGWIVSIDASLALLDKLRSKYQALFLMTSRVNQDCLENLFSRIRYIGGSDTHPGCVEFMNRLRLLVLGQSSAFVVETAPVRTADEEEDMDTVLSQKIVEGIDSDEPTDLIIPELGIQEEMVVNTAPEGVDCTMEAVKYLAGYVARKFRGIYPELSADGTMDPPVECPWIDTFSFGGLTRPSSAWLEQYQKFEGEFNNLFGDKIAREPMVINKLEKHLSKKFPESPLQVVKFYSKMRIHIRIKYMRIQYKTSAEEKRNAKKLKHFVT